MSLPDISPQNLIPPFANGEKDLLESVDAKLVGSVSPSRYGATGVLCSSSSTEGIFSGAGRLDEKAPFVLSGKKMKKALKTYVVRR